MLFQHGHVMLSHSPQLMCRVLWAWVIRLIATALRRCKDCPKMSVESLQGTTTALPGMPVRAGCTAGGTLHTLNHHIRVMVHIGIHPHVHLENAELHH